MQLAQLFLNPLALIEVPYDEGVQLLASDFDLGDGRLAEKLSPVGPSGNEAARSPNVRWCVTALGDRLQGVVKGAQVGSQRERCQFGSRVQ